MLFLKEFFYCPDAIKGIRAIEVISDEEYQFIFLCIS
jgi:hypothetical protein